MGSFDGAREGMVTCLLHVLCIFHAHARMHRRTQLLIGRAYSMHRRGVTALPHGVIAVRLIHL